MKDLMMKHLSITLMASLSAAPLAACGGSGSPSSAPQLSLAPQVERGAIGIGASWSSAKIAGIYRPTGIALDLAGDVYVASSQRGIIAKISNDGTKTTVVSHLYEPYGIALYKGYLYVAESGASRVDKISPSGQITQIGRSWSIPRGLAVDRAGNLYVTDSGLDAVFKVSRSGSITQLQPGFSFGATYGVAVDGKGTVYVTSVGNNAVYEVPPTGPVIPIGSGWHGPFGIAVGKNGVIFAANFYASEITEIQGGRMTHIRGLDFGRPLYLMTDKFGNVFVTSHDRGAVYKLSPS